MVLLPSATLQQASARFVVMRDGTRFEYRPLLTPELARNRAAARRHYDGNRLLVRDTSEYNCVGLVFAGRRGWQTTEQDLNAAVLRWLKADGYVPTTIEALIAGDIVAYGRESEIEHVGVATGVYRTLHPTAKMMVVSKFGRAGEYVHEVDDVPVNWFGTILSCWTQQFGD